jgi:hypothetical protein
MAGSWVSSMRSGAQIVRSWAGRKAPTPGQRRTSPPGACAPSRPARGQFRKASMRSPKARISGKWLAMCSSDCGSRSCNRRAVDSGCPGRLPRRGSAPAGPVQTPPRGRDSRSRRHRASPTAAARSEMSGSVDGAPQGSRRARRNARPVPVAESSRSAARSPRPCPRSRQRPPARGTGRPTRAGSARPWTARSAPAA